MIRFLIDEEMPESTARLPREGGVESFDVRETGLRGAEDGLSNGLSSCPFPISCLVRLDGRAPGS